MAKTNPESFEVGWCQEHEKEHFIWPDGTCAESHDRPRGAKPGHTPGPWAFYKGHPSDPEITVGTKDTYTVAKVSIAAGRGQAGPKKGRANAQIIAAAPDLLAVVEAYIEDNHKTGSVAHLYKQACDAVAKAKGGA